METITLNSETAIENIAEISAETQIQLEQIRDEIKADHTRMIHHCILLGKHLSAARELAQSFDGGFLQWIKDELGWSRQYAYNYINVYETFGELPDEAQDLPIGLTAAIALGRPSTPEDARTEAIEMAKAGKPVSASTARDIIRQHKELDPETYPEVKTGNSTPNVTQFGDGNSKIPATEAQALHAVRLLIKEHYDDNQEAVAALNVGYPDNKVIAEKCQDIQGQNTEFKVAKALAEGVRNIVSRELKEQIENKPEETLAPQLSQAVEEIFQPIEAMEPESIESDNIIENLYETINSLRTELQDKEQEIERLRAELAQLNL